MYVCYVNLVDLESLIGVQVLVKPVAYRSKPVRPSSAAGSYAGFAGYIAIANALQGSCV